MKSPAILMVLFSILNYSCKHQPVEVPANQIPVQNIDTAYIPCNADTIYFVNEILPILISNCTMSGCHDEQSHADGVVLTDYNQIIQTGKVEAGNSHESEIYEVITENKADKRMPPAPNAALSGEQISKIKKWIEQGAKNNYCHACDTSSEIKYSAHILPVLQTYCIGCHSATNKGGGYDLSQFNTIEQLANNTKLLGAIEHLSGFSAMPKNGNKLSDCNILKIKKWIQNGAPNN